MLGSLDGILNAILAPALIVALPSEPRLVVIKITPFAPFTPYTAVADASFNTEIEATELISIPAIGRSIPSTNINGAVLFHELIPRTKICGSSSPGIPVLAVVATPGKLPVNAEPKSETPPERSSTLLVV